MDGSVKTVDEAEETFAAPVISAVPQLTGRSNSKKKQALPMIYAPSTMTAEAFRSLRTVLELKEVVDRQALLFTSAMPDEGKTFCSVNCAVASAQYGYSTLIVDADLRRPSVGRILGCNAPETKGLSDCLSGKATLVEAIHDTDIERLYIMPAGTQITNPAELMSVDKLSALFRNPLFDKFDRIIFDTPPVNAVSDALHLVRLATAVCLVVRAGKTPIQASKRAYMALFSAKAQDIGIILNRLPQDNHYHYGFKYGQKGVYEIPKYSRPKAPKA
jgi:capsular exopolysaccharide synthesis family protein